VSLSSGVTVINITKEAIKTEEDAKSTPSKQENPYNSDVIKSAQFQIRRNTH